MTPALSLARSAVHTLCARHGVLLVTPDDPAPLRTVIRAAIAAVTPLTTAEVDQRISFYVPRVVSELLDLLPRALRDHLSPGGAAIYLTERVWGDAALLVGIGAHELGHHRQDLRARGATGPVGSVLHAAGYALHSTVRLDSEVVCYTMDLSAAAIFGGVDPDAWIAGLLPILASTYRGDAHSVEHAERTLRSAAASLRAGALHGEGTPLHDLLRLLVSMGWDAGPWARAIAGERPTVKP